MEFLQNCIIFGLMKSTVVTSGELTGRTDTLPDRKIVREAQRTFCLSAEFWTRIKAGKIPYVFNKDKNTLEEANYTETMAELKKTKSQVTGSATNVPVTYREKDIYWLTDSEYPQVNETLQNIASIDTMRKSYQQQIEQFKK